MGIDAGGSHGPLWSRMAKGTAAQGLSQAMRILMRFIEVPLFLHYWGAQMYGEWLILTAIPIYLSMTDIGFTNAARRDMAMLIAQGDLRAALEVFQSTRLLIMMLSVGALFIFLALLQFVSPGQWFHFEVVDPVTAKLLLAILCVYTLLNLQNGLIYGGFYCVGHYGFGTVLYTLIQLVEFTLVMLAVSLGGGPVEAGLALGLGRLFGTVVMKLVLKQTVPWMFDGIGYASWNTVKRLTKPALASAAFPVGSAMNLQGIRLVIGATLGPIAVSVFTTLSMLSRITVQAFNSLSWIVEPELGRAFGKGDYTLFRQLFRRSCQITLWIASIGCLITWLLRNRLIRVWTTGKISVDDPVFALLLLAGMLNSVWFTAMKVANATNRHTKIAGVYLLTYAFSVVGAYAVAPVYNMTGVGAVLLAAELILGAYVLPHSLQLANDVWFSWIRTVAQPPLFLLTVSKQLVRSAFR